MGNFAAESMEQLFHLSGAHSSAARWNRKGHLTVAERVDGLIAESAMIAAGSGALTGAFGVAGAPAGILGCLAVQVRMVGAVAVVCGHDLEEPVVQLVCLGVVAGNGPRAAAGRAAKAVLARWLAGEAPSLGAELALRAAPAVLAQVAAFTGTNAGARSIARFIPAVGAVASAAIDYAWVRTTGSLSRRIFYDEAPAVA